MGFGGGRSMENMALKEESKLKILGLKVVTKKIPSNFAVTAFVTMQTAYQYRGVFVSTRW